MRKHIRLIEKYVSSKLKFQIIFVLFYTKIKCYFLSRFHWVIHVIENLLHMLILTRNK